MKKVFTALLGFMVLSMILSLSSYTMMFTWNIFADSINKASWQVSFRSIACFEFFILSIIIHLQILRTVFLTGKNANELAQTKELQVNG